MSELFTASASGTLRESFFTGTSAVVIPTARIGWQRGGGAGGGTAGGGIEVKVQAADAEDIVFLFWEPATDLQTFEDVREIVEAGTRGIQIEWSVCSDLGCGPSTFLRKVH